jgi:hypothetical protein
MRPWTRSGEQELASLSRECTTARKPTLMAHVEKVPGAVESGPKQGERGNIDAAEPIQTLGDGPVAPVEAGENAKTAFGRSGQAVQELGYVEPGLKGWLNLLGVSRAGRCRYNSNM